MHSAGTLGQMVSGSVFGTSLWGIVAGYPLFCLAVRLLGGWLLPAPPLLWRSLAALLLWLPRHCVWVPTWWCNGALASACHLAAERADKLLGPARRQAIQSGTWVQGMILIITW